MLFIVPNNDGEAVEIQNILNQNGYNYLVTNQLWGESWECLENDIKSEIQNYNDTIYGIELQGNPITKMCVNIDHHKYYNDDRSNPLSSLEQVANIIGVELTEYQRAVSDNDKGYIDLMIKNNYNDLIISKVRLQDRRAQGISECHDYQADLAISNAIYYENLTIVYLDHNKCAAVTDKLHGKYKNLLIICEKQNELDFYGDYDICIKLQELFKGWCGGTHPTGFWGLDNILNINFIIGRIIEILK